MRALLKLSGQALKAGGTEIVDRDYLWQLADVVKQAQDDEHQLSIVVGGGNSYRFVANRRDPRDERLNPTLAHGRGLISILFNALWLTDVFVASGVRTALFTSAFADERFATQFDPAAARRALDGGAVVVFGGGTGNPGVSTDVAGVELAHEMGVSMLLKATHTVDGVFTADPAKDPSASKLDRLTYRRALDDGLDIMDRRALEEASECGLETVVFSIKDPTNLTRVLNGEPVGSTITSEVQ